MAVQSNVAFKEWAVVVEALAQGEQILILRKGGIRERRGQFDVDHREFWLFPTQYHEDERSVIPSKRPALKALAAAAPQNAVDIQFYAVAEPVLTIADPAVLPRLQGRHIWAEPVLAQRFEFGREPGLHALVTRIYRRPAPERLPLRDSYGGCKSWIELERPLSTAGLTPVLSDAEFAAQSDEICELLGTHALSHP